MESTSTLQSPAVIKQQLYPQELFNAFLHYADSIKVLSLDCFDTLLWRNTSIPVDVFYALQHKPTFKKYQINAVDRMEAESVARSVSMMERGSNEVTLEEIFRTELKISDEADIAALVKEEIETEIETCYGFPPIYDIIEAAHARGIKIIIVSDTYLKQKELSQLLQACLPKAIFSCIDTIFCSSEFRKTKSEGLFVNVLKNLNLKPKDILHIGDNHTADFAAPQALGAHALHLKQFCKQSEEIFRMQNVSSTLIDPSIRYQRPAYNPFRGIISNASASLKNPAQLIGYLSLGPIMYSFARYLEEELTALKNAGKRPKVLFLMRDAHLLSQACKTFMGETVGHDVRISRFTALACSFYTANDVKNHIAHSIYGWDLATLCKQLLLSQDMISYILNKAGAAENTKDAFFKVMMEDKVVSHITQKSAAYRVKLKKYLQKNAKLEPGETVVLVDIGYIGRIQTASTRFFINDMQASDVTGRYLMSLKMPAVKNSRSGLADTDLFDPKAIKMLCENGFLFEELCCSADNSVSDFDNEGNPIYTQTAISAAQREKVKSIQEDCLRFVRDAKIFFEKSNTLPPFSMLRDAALAEMGRRVFFPTPIEIEYLKEFFHDIDGGSDASHEIFHGPDVELNLLRKQGLTFDAPHPYALRPAGFELSFNLMALRRFRFELSTEDMNYRRETLKAVVSQNNQLRDFFIQATATHDGYFSMMIPFNGANAQAAIMFGLHYQFVQIHSVELIKKEFLLSGEEYIDKVNLLPNAFFSNMVAKGAELYECPTTASSLMVAMPAGKYKANDDLVLRVTFRPVVARTA